MLDQLPSAYVSYVVDLQAFSQRQLDVFSKAEEYGLSPLPSLDLLLVLMPNPLNLLLYALLYVFVAFIL